MTLALTIPQPSYFSPSSTFWRVNREHLITLAASRALLMELAHPLVAEGVATHSNYKYDPFGRLFRTMFRMNTIIYGGAASAQGAARQINLCHARVHGVTEGGVHYQANNPLLKLWVLATLIDSVMVVHDQFVHPLSLDEKESYYSDSIVLGRLLGIPTSMMPATYNAFAAYVEAMVISETLTVSAKARDVAQALFNYPLVGGGLRAISFVGLGLLPTKIKEGFEIEWGAGQEKLLCALASFSRSARSLLPDVLCVNPYVFYEEWRRR